MPTLIFVKSQRSSTLDEDAAQIISKVFERQGALVTMELPTKKDLADGLKANRSDFQTALREAELRTQLEIEKVRSEIEKVRSETEKIRVEGKETEARLKIEIAKIRYNLLIWQLGIGFGLAAIMAKGFGWLSF